MQPALLFSESPQMLFPQYNSALPPSVVQLQPNYFSLQPEMLQLISAPWLSHDVLLNQMQVQVQAQLNQQQLHQQQQYSLQSQQQLNQRSNFSNITDIKSSPKTEQQRVFNQIIVSKESQGQRSPQSSQTNINIEGSDNNPHDSLQSQSQLTSISSQKKNKKSIKSSYKLIDKAMACSGDVPKITIVNTISNVSAEQRATSHSFSSTCELQNNNSTSSSTDCFFKTSCGSIQLNSDLETAFDNMQKSSFYRNSELIFQLPYSKQFKLKHSNCKNDEIVFSKIKEFKKNKPAEIKLDATLQPNQKRNSKFHNLNKLFMYKLLATFSQKNLDELNVPHYLHEILLKLINNLKHSTKEMKQYNKKTEFFSHDHYNLLFLHLNEQTLTYLSQNTFSVFLHNVCFDIDISSGKKLLSISKEKIQYINIVKRFCCQIVQNSNMLGVYNDMKPIEVQADQSAKEIEEDALKASRQDMRQAYTQRALKGILLLNQGIVIRRF